MAVPSAALLDALSKAFSYPMDGMETTTPALEILEPEQCGSFYEDVKKVLAASRTFETRTDEQLAYTRLFIGSFKMYAPPYASYYLSGVGQIGGATTSEVRDIFCQFGIKLGDEENAPADHLRYLLAFLALMARRYEETGDEAFAEAYADFRDEYILSWIHQCQTLVEKYAEHDYYKLLVALIVSVMEA